MEHLVYNKIISHITVRLSPHQFGFLSNRSTLHQLLILFNHIINGNDQTDVIYLDFHKAFDSIPHNELLLKLRSMGISGNLWPLVQVILAKLPAMCENQQHAPPLTTSSIWNPSGEYIRSFITSHLHQHDIPDCVASSIYLLMIPNVLKL